MDILILKIVIFKRFFIDEELVDGYVCVLYIWIDIESKLIRKYILYKGIILWDEICII